MNIEHALEFVLITAGGLTTGITLYKRFKMKKSWCDSITPGLLSAALYMVIMTMYIKIASH